MAKKKSVDQMSSQELFELAQQREQQEMDAEREAAKQQIDDLREQRKALIAEHKKALNALDREIKKLGGRSRKRKAGGRGGNITDTIVAIVGEAGEVSTGDIRAALESAGIEVANLSQTLAYLKRNGRLASPARSMYTLA